MGTRAGARACIASWSPRSGLSSRRPWWTKRASRLIRRKPGWTAQWPRETTVTVMLAEVGGGTQLTLRQTVEESIAERTGALACWQEMFDRLAEELDYVCELAR